MSDNNETDYDELFANLNAYQRDTLFVLENEAPCNGLDLHDCLTEYYGEESSVPRVYNNLNKLIGHSMVFKREEDGRTNRYDLTSRGEDVLEARRNWE